MEATWSSETSVDFQWTQISSSVVRLGAGFRDVTTGRMVSHTWIWKDLWKSGPKVLTQHLPGGTEKNHETCLSGYSIAGPRFEPGTSRKQVLASRLEPNFVVRIRGAVPPLSWHVFVAQLGWWALQLLSAECKLGKGKGTRGRETRRRRGKETKSFAIQRRCYRHVSDYKWDSVRNFFKQTIICRVPEIANGYTATTAKLSAEPSQPHDVIQEIPPDVTVNTVCCFAPTNRISQSRYLHARKSWVQISSRDWLSGLMLLV
jgi:hypothetical protein